MEAAGIEPASENDSREENYVRFRFVIVDRRFRTGKSDGDLARLISIWSSGQKLSTYPAK